MAFRLLIGALMIGSIYGLVGLGYSLIYKASGLMNFSQGDMLMLGAFVGLTFYKTAGLPFPIAMVLTFIVMFLVGFGIEKLIIRNLVSHNAPKIFIVLATIALSILFKNFAMLTWGSRLLRFPSIFGNLSSIKIAGIAFQPESILAVGASILCMIALHFFMTRTRFGTAMRSAAQDPLAARTCSIDVSLTTGMTWGLSAAIASLGGMLFGPVYGVSMSMGAQLGLKGFSSAVIGGYGNMYGAIVGGLILGFTETFASGYISSDFKDFISFGVLIIFLFLKPTGLFNERALQD